jgi:uncharacterized protein
MSSEWQADPSASRPEEGPIARYLGVAVLVGLIGGLVYVKWGASSRVVSAAANHVLDIKSAPYLNTALLAATRAYLSKVAVALTFGVLIGGTLRVVVSPTKVAEWLGGRGARSLLRGALAGAPLMLCSCCVTPIFASLHRRGARLGPSLSILFAAPALNVASLALTFMAFPARLAVFRVIAALLIVFGVAPLAGRLFESARRSAGQPEVCAVDAEEPLTLRTLPARLARSILHMAAMTVPIVIVGVLLSSLLLPHVQALSPGGVLLTIVVTALIASVVALPTFVEIPIALSILAAGGPPGVALAILIAGPVINLPSLIVLMREVGVRVALTVFISVWIVASLFGWLAGS